MHKFRSLFTSLFLGAALLFVAGCEDDGTNPTEDVLSAPANVWVELVQASSTPQAYITWDASKTETSEDFLGYRVLTYRVEGSNLVRIDSADVMVANAKFHSVSLDQFDPSKNTKYVTHVRALIDEGDDSDEISVAKASIVYAPVYEGNGEIDEYVATSGSSAESGYGWDKTTGAGTQYPYSSANASKIDLHMRKSGVNYNFYNPKSVTGAPAGAKETKLALLGSGEAAFAKTTDLTEPNLNEINIANNNVYLLKITETDGKIYYVKVMVTNLSTTGTYASTVFNYKVQPVENFKVLKH